MTAHDLTHLIAAAWLGVACTPAFRSADRTDTSPPTTATSHDESPATEPDAPVLASAASSWLEKPRTVELEVPGFLPAVMVVPSGNDVRPLVAAAHGAGGAPEWECDYWQRLTSGKAFVLCLRGTAMGGGSFYFKQHYALRDELVAATRAARAAHPRIASGGGIYAGFSQGASMGSLVVADQGEQYAYAVMIEGFLQWNVALARKYGKSGGKGALFVCGTQQCAGKAELSAQASERGGLKARADHAVGAGHTPMGGVLPLVEQGLPWLLEGDPRWQ